VPQRPFPAIPRTDCKSARAMESLYSQPIALPMTICQPDALRAKEAVYVPVHFSKVTVLYQSIFLNSYLSFYLPELSDYLH
jgi:hypothetical protein